MKVKEFLKREWGLWLIILVPYLLTFILWDRIPAQIPTHWNLQGKVDDYSTKEVGILLFPLINIAIYLFMLAIPKIDPRAGNYNLFKNSYTAIRYGLSGFLSAMAIIEILAAIGYRINIGNTVMALISALMLIFGYFIRNIRSNYFIGIRTPWTLNNAEVWRRTHKLASMIWVPASALMLILSIILNTQTAGIIFIIYFGIIIVIPVVYSFAIYKKYEHTDGESVE